MKKFAVTALLVLSLLVPFTMGAAQRARECHEFRVLGHM